MMTRYAPKQCQPTIVDNSKDYEKAKEALAKQLHKKVEDLTEDEGGVFIFFADQSPRIFERWAKIFEDLSSNVIEGESIPERFRVMKNVVIDWYNLPEPCFKKYDKKIYHKGNLIHNIGDTIVDKTGNTKVYTKVKVVSYKVARGEDGEPYSRNCDVFLCDFRIVTFGEY